MYRTGWRNGPPEIAALPDLELGGRLMSLHQALIRDAEATGYNDHPQGALRAALDAYLAVNAPETVGAGGSQLGALVVGPYAYANRQTAFDHLIDVWTGMDGFAPNARSGALSLRQTSLLELAYGPGYQNPGWVPAIVRETAYQRLYDGPYASLAAQKHYKSDYGLIEWRGHPDLNEEIGHLEGVTEDDGGRGSQAASAARSCGRAAKSLRSGCGVRGRQLCPTVKCKSQTRYQLERCLQRQSAKSED